MSYGNLLNKCHPILKNLFRKYEKSKVKILKAKWSNKFNNTCINENIYFNNLIIYEFIYITNIN